MRRGSWTEQAFGRKREDEEKQTAGSGEIEGPPPED